MFAYFSLSSIPDNWLSVVKRIGHDKYSTFNELQFSILNAIWYMALFDAWKSRA